MVAQHIIRLSPNDLAQGGIDLGLDVSLVFGSGVAHHRHQGNPGSVNQALHRKGDIHLIEEHKFSASPAEGVGLGHFRGAQGDRAGKPGDKRDILAPPQGGPDLTARRCHVDFDKTCDGMFSAADSTDIEGRESREGEFYLCVGWVFHHPDNSRMTIKLRDARRIGKAPRSYRNGAARGKRGPELGRAARSRRGRDPTQP